MVTLPHSREMKGACSSGTASAWPRLWGHPWPSHKLSPRTAVDEQNAQTQEQERIVLGLSESEGKKDLKPDDRVCQRGSCGAAKCRSLRKGSVRLAWGPRRRHRALSPLSVPREVSGCFLVIAVVIWQCRSQDTRLFFAPPILPTVCGLSGGRWVCGGSFAA